ncbi:MAG TPA: IclR family transcriptional regulator [Thermomicrobiales bacterium]|jgi:DNA-binding IclR family transcriptional regulator|nr:IclR family transcriptional regulator [Thermomicrobiales bacterium]
MNPSGSLAAAPATVKSADRCLDLLELLAQHPDGLTLSEVCAFAGWPKSSALALLRTLERRDYVLLAANGSSYLLGPRVASLGSAYLDRITLAEEGLEVVRAVSRAVDETVHLAVLRGKEVLYVAKAEGGGQMRMVSAVGRMIPAHGTGVGKVLLANLPGDRLEELFPPGEPLARLTARTVTDREAFLRELARIRQQDYATDDGESTIGLRCIAAPVRDVHGQIVAAMSVSVPEPRFTADRVSALRSALMDGARRLSARLGCPPALLRPAAGPNGRQGTCGDG